ncbi:hypothetical protein [Rhodohalobacter barkolensis]|uniref:DUF4402 domain-containing protein n=1 Tax=Rhodohalobacter barkolensis TaxID=2053187 RepID=A0A2N0VJ46_9BACT|nr:hypothetical protein [Rhodohalobacter barkolensis]PKD44184.1 hypothetical protein CWD77_01575 [Rhodohalobacter barkolensis]
MKKLSSLIIALFVLSAGTVFAQTNTAEIGVTADVLAELNVAGTDVSFGNVQQGSVAEVQANGSDITSSNASAPSAGSLTITADGQEYIVEVTQNAVLENADGDQLTFTHRVFDGGNDVTADVDGTGYNVSGGGDLTLDIGGQLQSPTASGNYSTNTGGGLPLVFEVNYNI